MQQSALLNPDQEKQAQLAYEAEQEQEVQGIYVMLESAEGLVAPVDVEMDEEQAADEKDDSDAVSMNAGKLNPTVTLTLGKSNHQSRRKRDTANPVWHEEMFLPLNEKTPDSMIVLEVFGNARIFRMDGRLGQWQLPPSTLGFVSSRHGWGVPTPPPS